MSKLFSKRMTFDQYQKSGQRVVKDDAIIDLMKPMQGFLGTRSQGKMTINRVLVDNGIGDVEIDGQFMKALLQTK